MNKFVCLIIITLCYIQSNAQVSMHQAEHDLHDFKTTFQYESKVLSLVNSIENDVNKKNLARLFIKGELPDIETTLNQLVNGTIAKSDLNTIYTNAFNSLNNSNTITNDYLIFENTFRANNTLGGTRAPNLPCVNIDFEANNYGGWDPEIGSSCNTSNNCITGVTAGTGVSGGGLARHEIVGTGFDPNVPMLRTNSPFGGSYSLRLGNSNSGGDAETIAHTFLVTPKKEFFTYSFAVVMEDPNHTLPTQPFFEIQFFDQNNIPIQSCGNYFVAAGANNPGFQTQGFNIRWKDWAQVSVDLTAYIGQNVTIKFTVSDCDLGGHFGYAYIDAECSDFPDITIGPDCNGTKLVAPPGYQTYLWNTGANTQEIVVTAGGAYSVTVTSESGCTYNLDTVIPPYVPMDYTFATTQAFCNTSNDGTIVFSPTGGHPPYEYSIDGGNTFQSSHIFSSVPSGSHTIQLRDRFNCIVEKTANIDQTNPLVINKPASTKSDISCFGLSDGYIDIVASGGTGLPTFQYSIDSGQTYFITNSFSNLPLGVYDIVVRDSRGCEARSSDTIIEPEQIILNSTPEACYERDSDITLSANATGGVQPYTYEWLGIDEAASVTIPAPTTDQTYTVNLTDRNGCTESTQSLVKLQPFVAFEANVTEACEPGEITFTNLSNVQSSKSCIWNFTDGDVVFDCNNTVSHTFNDRGTYLVSLSIEETNGCISDSLIVDYITIHPTPTADFDYYITNPNTVRNRVEFWSLSIDEDSENWTINGSPLSTDSNFFHVFESPDAGVYNICLEASTVHGCVNQICKEVVVLEDILVFVPNIFTPDGNTLNDVFEPIIDGVKAEGFLFTVYNRWGKIVYQSSDILNCKWDGSVDGQLSPDGAYVWTLKALPTDETKVEKNFKGHFILSR